MMKCSKKIAILGANSFLAKNFYKFLVDKHGFKKESLFLYDIQTLYELSNNTQYQQIDFLDLKSINKIDFEVDYIYIFNGKTGVVDGFSEPQSFLEVNEISILNILNEYKNQESHALIVYPSTRLVYKSSAVPLNEDAEKELKSVYAITKYSAENYIRLYHDVFNIQYTILRISVPWGSLLPNSGNYGTFKFFMDLAKSNKPITVFGDGKIIKTYTHIEDICYILLACMNNEKLKNDTFNIGGQEKALIDIASIIASYYSVKVIFTDWPEVTQKVDGGNTILDSSKLDSLVSLKYKQIDNNFLTKR